MKFGYVVYIAIIRNYVKFQLVAFTSIFPADAQSLYFRTPRFPSGPGELAFGGATKKVR